MTENDFQPNWFSKPSESIKSAMAARNLNLNDVTTIADTPANEFAELYLGTREIKESDAEVLAKLFGTGPDFWTSRQEQYDEMVGNIAASLDTSVVQSWLKAFPKRELETSGWIQKTSTKEETLRQLIKFFDVLGPKGWETKYAEYLRSVNFRTSEIFQNKLGALTAWLRRAELEAELISTDTWSVESLKASLPELRKLTTELPPEIRTVT